MNYYLFKTEQEAINALNYVNQVGLSLFPPERVTPEGIISINALTGLPEPDATKTVTWDTIKELKEVGWYFTVPTEEVVGMPIPHLQIPGEFEIISEQELEERFNRVTLPDSSNLLNPLDLLSNPLTIEAEVVESDCSHV